jgi:O-antigen/teichoic acid export membrane protein
MFDGVSGDRLGARVARSTSWIILGYGTSQALRLGSNLLLTRLLFPEAFGLMALITTVTVGLMLFSDIGISPAIAQSKRGDDPAFLDTAWTIQVLRGGVLWAVAALLAWPVAAFYDQPELSYYLPIAALTLVIAGFNPTRIETAHRHLLMGRLTALDLLSQFAGIVAMAVLAVLLQSVMALVLGGLVGALAKLLLTHLFLPGGANRFRFERAALRELLGFGRWIFLSTACFFFASQGDKLILGKVLSMEGLGIYNIGFFLASFPVLLAAAVTQRVMIPVYRENAAPSKIRRLRYLMSAGPILLLVLLSLLGPWLVALLYDDRYATAGAVVVLLSLAFMPQVIGTTYDQAALARGDSRRFFLYSAARSILQFGLMLLGAVQAGLAGALAGMALALVSSHLVLIWLARVQKVWDPRHDLIFALVAVLSAALALAIHGALVARQLTDF